jgi:hypothetical protein
VDGLDGPVDGHTRLVHVFLIFLNHDSVKATIDHDLLTEAVLSPRLMLFAHYG